ncbi:MAG: hypothetical protein C0605_17635 [Hyphomicrobiales bacterium]|nr:MAG: hypothetical protein C0605_17635 [Hyphomicrobiales bacterium]
MDDGVLSIVWLAVFIAGAVVLIFLVGFIIIPAAIAGGGVLYYLNNHYWPKMKEEEKQDRTRALYQQALSCVQTKTDLRRRLQQAGITDDTLLWVASQLYDMEGLTPPDEPPVVANTIEAARYRDKLSKYIESAQPNHYREFSNEVVDILANEQATGEGIFHSKSLRTPEDIEDLIIRFYDTEDCFKELRRRLDRNYNEQKGILPTKYKGDNCQWDYLKDTPLLKMEYVERRVSLTNRTRHTHILGASGSGKSVLIEYIISRDLTGDEDNCVVLIDSQVQLIPKLADVRLNTDDVTFVNPSWNLALNLFDVGYQEMKNAGIEGERLINTTVDLLGFVLEGMMGTELSDQQKTVFQYAIQLVISIPGGNIFTFFDILAKDGHLKYGAQIKEFDENTQAFFINDFGSKEYKISRDAIRRRLQSMLRNPTFRRLFSATENKIDMYEELQDRRLILIDTNMPMLGRDASAFFGRLFIALIVQASHRRFDNRDKTFKPVYLFVDEAHEYFDAKISEILEQARKSNIGLTVAHQSISQAKEILDPLMVNTATKMVSTGYKKDAQRMAESMRTSAEAILSLPQYSFGMTARGLPFTQIRAVPDPLSNLPKRYEKYELQEVTEARYGVTSEAERSETDTEVEIDPAPEETATPEAAADLPEGSPAPKGNGAKPPPPEDPPGAPGLGDVEPI